MSYMHIPNLYADQTILLFKEGYALEKIDGTSAHLTFHQGVLKFSSGGAPHRDFMALFDPDRLSELLAEQVAEQPEVPWMVYGEAYGGKIQGQTRRYGAALKFVAFEVRRGDTWLTVPGAARVVERLGLEFVHYAQVPLDLEHLDAERDADSVQSARNGQGPGHKREGVVLRPLVEMIRGDGARVIAKHKRDDFRETASPRKVGEPLVVLDAAQAIAEEWVTTQRLEHVCQALARNGTRPSTLRDTGQIVAAMVEDVLREGSAEIVDSPSARKAIGARAARLWQARLRQPQENYE